MIQPTGVELAVVGTLVGSVVGVVVGDPVVGVVVDG